MSESPGVQSGIDAAQGPDSAPDLTPVDDAHPDAEHAPGLRERKRLATRSAILEAALDSVEEHGIDGATIDDISRRAGISPRTFFNYFPSKEAAIAGDPPALADETARLRFLAGGGGLFHDLVELVAESAAKERIDSRDRVLQRVYLVKHAPEVLALRMSAMRGVEADLAALVAERIFADPDAVGVAAEEAERAAQIIVGALFAAVRSSWFSWASGDGSTELGDYVRADCATLERVILGPLGR